MRNKDSGSICSELFGSNSCSRAQTLDFLPQKINRSGHENTQTLTPALVTQFINCLGSVGLESGHENKQFQAILVG